MRSQTDRLICWVDGVERVSVGRVDELVVDEQLMWETQIHVVCSQLNLQNKRDSFRVWTLSTKTRIDKTLTEVLLQKFSGCPSSTHVGWGLQTSLVRCHFNPLNLFFKTLAASDRGVGHLLKLQFNVGHGSRRNVLHKSRVGSTCGVTGMFQAQHTHTLIKSHAITRELGEKANSFVAVL